MNSKHKVIEQLETNISTNQSSSCREETDNNYRPGKITIRSMHDIDSKYYFRVFFVFVIQSVVFFYFSGSRRNREKEESTATTSDLIAAIPSAGNDCPACAKKLPFPRTCAMPMCNAGIHRLSECSHPLNTNLDNEGSGAEARICRTCHLKRSRDEGTVRRKKRTGIFCKCFNPVRSNHVSKHSP